MHRAIRRPWTQMPPAGVPLDAAHPLYSYIRFAWSANSGNLVPQYGPLTITTNGFTGPFYGQRGNTIVRASGSGTGKIQADAAPQEGAQSCILIFVGNSTGTPANLDRLFSTFNGTGFGNYDVFFHDTIPRGWIFQTIRSTAGQQWKWENSSTFSGCLVAQFLPLSSSLRLAYNGQEITLAIFQVGSGDAVASSGKIALLGRPDVTTRQPPVDASFCAVMYDAVVDFGRLIELSRNPWSLFRQRVGVEPLDVVSGYTHPTLSAATLVPAGGNTYQPRVTYTF